MLALRAPAFDHDAAVIERLERARVDEARRARRAGDQRFRLGLHDLVIAYDAVSLQKFPETLAYISAESPFALRGDFTSLQPELAGLVECVAPPKVR